ncbi:MAG TPA: protease modulator HflK, partial [Gammaproteobacteria bacterium]
MARSPKVMLDVEGGNNLMFLPLDQLMNRAATSSSGLKGLSGNSSDSQSLIDEFTRNASRNRERESRQ